MGEIRLSLFDIPLVDVGRRGTIEERFTRFDAANPHVYRLIVMLARQSLATGAQRLSMKQIFENIRASYQISRSADEPYKLDNSFTALFARAVGERCPELRPFFEMRRRRHDREAA